MVTVKRLHCAYISNMIIYSDNMITSKCSLNGCINLKERLHFSMVRNYRKFSNFNNQQWWRPGSMILRRHADSSRRLKLLRDIASLVLLLTLEVRIHDRLVTFLLLGNWVWRRFRTDKIGKVPLLLYNVQRVHSDCWLFFNNRPNVTSAPAVIAEKDCRSLYVCIRFVPAPDGIFISILTC